MYSTDFLDDENYASKAQKQNRLLIEEEDPDDGYVRPGGRGGGGQLLAPAPQFQRRQQSPLIEEEMPESQPFLMSHGKANAARQIYDRKQAAKKPWKKGMPYSQATLNMFDKSTPYEKKMFGGVRNPRQAMNLDAKRPGGFQKLFGAKMSKDEILDRKAADVKPKQSVWGWLKNVFTGGDRKASWMEMLFGARKRNAGTSAKSMGITSTNAPHGQSSGWANQLVDAGKAGNLGEGREGSAMSEQLLAPGGQKESPANKSYEDLIEDEEKVPAASKQPLLTAKQAKHNSFMETMYAMQQLNAADKSNDNADAHQTIDDNSIDESDNGDGYEKNGLYNQKLLDNYMHDDDQQDEEDGQPGFLQDHIMSIFNKK